jgi:membrane protease YdiL (CAAX protease family)
VIGALVLLIFNLLILRWFGQGPAALGFNRPARRALEFAVGLLGAAAFAVMQMILLARLAGFEWIPNPAYGFSSLLEGLRWNVASVLFEELIFRGALLWAAMRWLGVLRGALVSAACFGVYHWFSFGLLGDPVVMAFVFVLTGSFGLMTAWAYAWSGSIVLPIALHLGWNLTVNEVFSNGPLGERWLIAGIEDIQWLAGAAQLLVSVVVPLSLPVLALVVMNLPLRRWRNRPAGLQPADQRVERKPGKKTGHREFTAS